MFFLLVLDIPMDFVMVKKDSCMNCTQNKLNAKILTKFEISKKEFKLYIKEYNIKGFNVKCECQ